MGFKTNKSKDTNEDWKAAGFLNVYINSINGKKKLYGIPLRENTPKEKKLSIWLEEDPLNITTLYDRLVIEYIPNTSETDSFID